MNAQVTGKVAQLAVTSVRVVGACSRASRFGVRETTELHHKGGLRPVRIIDRLLFYYLISFSCICLNPAPSVSFLGGSSQTETIELPIRNAEFSCLVMLSFTLSGHREETSGGYKLCKKFKQVTLRHIGMDADPRMTRPGIARPETVRKE